MCVEKSSTNPANASICLVTTATVVGGALLVTLFVVGLLGSFKVLHIPYPYCCLLTVGAAIPVLSAAVLCCAKKKSKD